MKLSMKIAAVMAIVLLAFVLLVHNEGEGSIWETLKNPPSSKEEKTESSPLVQVTRQDGTIEKIPLETYLEGVVGSEMPASYELEALKAQSVAARTFVMQRNMEVDDTTRTQVYHDDKQLRQIWGNQYETYHKKVKEAISATAHEVMTYDGTLISAVFFSTSCGKTANSEEYWGSKTPYLRSVDSSWDQQVSGYEETITISNEDFHTRLGFQNNVVEISQPVYYASGYVKSITIDRITFTGREIREKLQLRSSSFTIKKNRDGYTITTKGYGHGLGMSQKGAQAMALEGKDYQTILKHYYQGIKIEKKDV